MKTSVIAIPLAILALASCDKAKKLADEASSAVKEQVAKAATGGTDSKIETDPELAKLVDRNDEGVVFRKDLPFPARLDVRTTSTREISARFYEASAIDKRMENIKGTRFSVAKLERAGDQVRYTLEESAFSNPPDKDSEEPATRVNDPLQVTAPSNKPRTFLKSGGTWRTDDVDGFRAAVLSKQLSPVFNSLLEENGLAPRPLWFGKRRVKTGEEIAVSGDSLSMLLAGNAKGDLKLKLESFEGVEGHPCGVFSVTGDFSRKQFPDFEGSFSDEDVTIQSGKVWLSLIHPVVLKWDIDTIQTSKHGDKGNAVSRLQGTVKLTVVHAWKALGK